MTPTPLPQQPQPIPQSKKPMSWWKKILIGVGGFVVLANVLPHDKAPNAHVGDRVYFAGDHITACNMSRDDFLNFARGRIGPISAGSSYYAHSCGIINGERSGSVVEVHPDRSGANLPEFCINIPDYDGSPPLCHWYTDGFKIVANPIEKPVEKPVGKPVEKETI